MLSYNIQNYRTWPSIGLFFQNLCTAWSCTDIHRKLVLLKTCTLLKRIEIFQCLKTRKYVFFFFLNRIAVHLASLKLKGQNICFLENYIKVAFNYLQLIFFLTLHPRPRNTLNFVEFRKSEKQSSFMVFEAIKVSCYLYHKT